MQTKNSARMEHPEKKNFADPYYTENRTDEGSDLGAIMVHHGVIAVIARTAALKVPGVVETSSSFADGIANIASMIGRNTGERGVSVKMQGQKVNVEINLIIEYGAKIPAVAWAVQNEVRQAVEEMTGKQVGAIDVVVQGVRLPLETKSAAGESPARRPELESAARPAGTGLAGGG
ncbi:MAG: Asp23/Gls24 family envelope stress response protein [Kiritimatiellae bacterium]|jgi:uncharacterized alkaline shock family protein YloU|nr:Asp23/Gls24 family envelope stress response protein [Kiritimatiellia bacterium]